MSALSKTEAANYLGLSTRQVQRLIAKAMLPYYIARGPRGNVLQFIEDDLNKFVETRKRQLYVPIGAHAGKGPNESLAGIFVLLTKIDEKLSAILGGQNEFVASIRREFENSRNVKRSRSKKGKGEPVHKPLLRTAGFKTQRPIKRH